jgi:hypothetical protein
VRGDRKATADLSTSLRFAPHDIGANINKIKAAENVIFRPQLAEASKAAQDDSCVS